MQRKCSWLSCTAVVTKFTLLICKRSSCPPFPLHSSNVWMAHTYRMSCWRSLHSNIPRNTGFQMFEARAHGLSPHMLGRLSPCCSNRCYLESFQAVWEGREEFHLQNNQAGRILLKRIILM